MTLCFDLQTMQASLFLPEGASGRERRMMRIAEGIRLIESERRRRVPRWARYYVRHRERMIAKQRAYRANNREKVKEYNRWYYQMRKAKAKMAEGEMGVSGG
ncbi:MAG: hypothetical protein QHG99_05135 [Methanomicrobiales archaeon]|nr:hypothetical protein [Methanomicrobiales archaeon]